MSPGRCALNKEFRICNCINEPLLSQNNAGKKWEKPSKRFIKVNFDATVGENGSGYGTIVRDDEGFVLGGGGGFIESRLSVEEAECVALEESIKVACKLNLKEHVFFETDHVGLVNRLINKATDITIIGARNKVCTGVVISSDPRGCPGQCPCPSHALAPVPPIVG
ncbi:hypothetical protein J1N35_046173 [Gossypium stocksii]|uniref:RNase H type-1 domain-containing protein n=1 Tax=Gossypium stocksii TaxID=47602 RepID=A0A9D3U5L4_9ROSI|nr:hypothetical protein J1N35_046173 [Gossypium stocksii]